MGVPAPETSATAGKNGGIAGKNRGSGLVPILIVSCLINVVLGLALVLVSIDKTELGYEVRKLEGQVKTREDHMTELEVEHGRLVSPYVLEKKAAELGMGAAKPGQIRRMGNATLETLPR